jgi:hypothetical protein
MDRRIWDMRMAEYGTGERQNMGQEDGRIWDRRTAVYGTGVTEIWDRRKAEYGTG